VLEPWIAAAAIGVGLLVIAGLLALIGKREIEEAGPPKPELAMESVQRDVETVKARARS
jgi:ABC-type phosphate transport system auxiliary subunit